VLTRVRLSFLVPFGWQTPIEFSGSFSPGYYWITFTSPAGNSQNYYNIYSRNYQVDNSEAMTSPDISGPWQTLGASILWIRQLNGSSLQIYPYENAIIPGTTQSFTAQSSFQFNTVFLFLSDRHYSTVNGTLQIADMTEGGKIVASGTLSQAADRGLQNWIPITLNTIVNATAGDTYLITLPN